MKFELKVTETKNKAGKFHYQVFDENGTLISERRSNREYAACTSGGANYFGRVDLAVKWQASQRKLANEWLSGPQFNKPTSPDITPWDYHKHGRERLESVDKIAYKK